MIEAYGGIARVVPLFATMLTIVSLSSIGSPAPTGSSASSSCCVGAFKTQPVLTVISATGVIFAAAYLLWAHPADPLQPARQAGERAHSRPQQA